MKQRFSFAVFILYSAFSTSVSLGQLNIWRQQNPSGTGVTFRAVQMISLQTIYACGDNASFGKSTDGGVSWIIQSPAAGLLVHGPYALNFYSLSFLDTNYGMACGDSGRIIKTIDGGVTWSIFFAGGINSKFYSITLLDTNIAIAVGKGGLIVRTSDGGATWITLPREIASDFTCLRKLRADFLSLSGFNGSLFTSNDSGKSWTPVPIILNGNKTGENIYGHVFTNDMSATLVGENGFMCQTLDGGKNWSKQTVADSSVLSDPLNYIDGKDPNVMAIVGDYGTILYTTTNGGVHWNHYKLLLQDSLIGLSFFDRYNAIAVGQDGVVMRTSDGGVTWKFLPERPLTDALYGVAFQKSDTSLGIAVGFASILRTTNGGSIWNRAIIDTVVTLRAVTFLESKNLIAIGDYGVIVKSTDAGLNWSTRPNTIYRNLRSMSFPTQNFGWVCGDSGSLFSTTDAGASWTQHSFSKKRTLTGISFADSLHGYLCSDKGVYSTIDGGVTWEDPDDNTYFVPCVGISSPSPNVVCVIGTGCGGSPGVTVLSSNDGGKNWITRSLNSGAGGIGTPSGVYFSDDLHGTVVGGNPGNKSGFIYHTIDGGKTWIYQPSNAFWSLSAVFFGTNKAGTAVGYRGTIMRRTTDE